MKFKIIIVNIWVFFVMESSLHAADTSFFLQKDKQLHIAGSAVIASAVTALARNRGSSKVEAFFYGAGAAIAVGLLKEGLDGVDDEGTREWADVGADVIGATAGAFFSAQFEWKF